MTLNVCGRIFSILSIGKYSTRWQLHAWVQVIRVHIKILLVMTASYTKSFHFFPHLVFSQKISSFLRTAIVAEIRFLISCFGSIFYVTLMPRYLTSSDAFIL